MTRHSSQVGRRLLRDADDIGAGANLYLVIYDGNNCWVITATKATWDVRSFAREEARRRRRLPVGAASVSTNTTVSV